MRPLRTIAIIAFVCLAGLGAGEIIYRSIACRDALGRFFGRGRLLALAEGMGIYEIDARRAIEEDSNTGAATEETNAPKNAVNRLIVDVAIRALSQNETVNESEVERELDLLWSQFGNEKALNQAMANLPLYFLRTQARGDLKTRQWIEKRLLAGISVSEKDCREYFAAHRDAFALALRLRARHLFLAAPPEAPEEVVEAKRLATDSLSVRIALGQDFAELAAEASEDEATNGRGGDLGFFSSWRMLPELFEPVAALRVGEISKPIRSHLGFHIVQLIDLKPAREIPFEEARSEIIGILQNEQRITLARKLANDLSQSTEYFDHSL